MLPIVFPARGWLQVTILLAINAVALAGLAFAIAYGAHKGWAAAS